MSLSSDIYTISTALSDIKDAIIEKGVTPSGNITTYADAISQISGGGGSSTKYGCTAGTFLGDVDANGVLQIPSDTSGDIVFSGVKDAGHYALMYKYYNNTNLTHSVSFSDLEEVSGTNAMYGLLYFTHISSISFPKLKTISGSNALQQLVTGTYLTTFSMPELETISGMNGLRQAAQSCTSLTTVFLPKLKTITGGYGLAYFIANCSAITTLSLPNLETASGNGAFQNLCYACSNFETLYLQKLSDISGTNTFNSAFISCPKITDIYFNGLTTTSFGSNINQFNSMFNTGTTGTAGTSGTCTVHFPSNLQTTISNLTGYPTFGGDANRIVLSFDLPTTT